MQKMNQKEKNKFPESLKAAGTTKDSKSWVFLCLGELALYVIRYASKIGRTIISILNLIKTAIHGA
jgi:hypothetical protein